LAHAWGRDKGFHHQIVANVCERRGEVDRKRQGVGGGGVRGSMMEAKRNRMVVEEEEEEVPTDETDELESPHNLSTAATEI
jgi:hypothetical protein